MQKLLFICYGLVYAQTGTLLFEDDKPRTWPFGPVFPRVFRRYEDSIPHDLSKSEKDIYASKPEALRIVARVVDAFIDYSASTLSEWSHHIDGPWYATLVKQMDAPRWNRVINDEDIRKYFSETNWEKHL